MLHIIRVTRDIRVIRVVKGYFSTFFEGSETVLDTDRTRGIHHEVI